ncbi:MAG TPA: hypothetical protein VNK92_06500 [Vicinamibacterales bacterium]|nr:hypothetical protein [Vicinamibacterales bacterium]
MIGGLQFRALHAEIVGTGRMTNRAFHDTMLRAGSVPVEMIRASLARQALPERLSTSWRFAGALE